MKVELLYFGPLGEIAGKESEQLDIQALTNVQAIKKFVTDKYPDMKNHSFAVAVNQEIVEEEHLIDSESEIAFLPPFAGG